VGLERGPLSLASTTEELLGRNISGSGLEIIEYGRIILQADHVALYQQKLALTSRRSLGRYSSFVDSGYGFCCFFFVEVPETFCL
jgi:hypothetical protein